MGRCSAPQASASANSATTAFEEKLKPVYFLLAGAGACAGSCTGGDTDNGALFCGAAGVPGFAGADFAGALWRSSTLPEEAAPRVAKIDSVSDVTSVCQFRHDRI